MIGYSNSTLAKCPPLNDGDEVHCPDCGVKHVAHGEGGLLFVRCDDGKVRLVGCNGKNIIGVEPDVSASRPSVQVCDRCWKEREPTRTPVRMREAAFSNCAVCRDLTVSGIFVPQGWLVTRDPETPDAA